MKVQVVMPAINLWRKYSLPAIESVEAAMVYAKQKGIETRLLFIDNASTDETKAEAGARVNEHFSHKRNEERWGFQRSVNYGVNDGFERGFDYVLVCNNDILLHPAALVRLVEGFEKERDFPVGLVSCLDTRGESTPAAFSQISTAVKEAVPEAVHPNFSAFMVDRECWEKVGEMDEVFAPAYFEDNDYHYRMRLAGLAAIVYPPAIFYHFGSGTQNEAAENGRPIVPTPLFENNRAFYAKKWGGVPGNEKYEHPYNDPALTLRATKQNTLA